MTFTTLVFFTTTLTSLLPCFCTPGAFFTGFFSLVFPAFAPFPIARGPCRRGRGKKDRAPTRQREREKGRRGWEEDRREGREEGRKGGGSREGREGWRTGGRRVTSCFRTDTPYARVRELHPTGRHPKPDSRTDLPQPNPFGEQDNHHELSTIPRSALCRARAAYLCWSHGGAPPETLLRPGALLFYLLQRRFRREERRAQGPKKNSAIDRRKRWLSEKHIGKREAGEVRKERGWTEKTDASAARCGHLEYLCVIVGLCVCARAHWCSAELLLFAGLHAHQTCSGGAFQY